MGGTRSSPTSSETRASSVTFQVRPLSSTAWSSSSDRSNRRSPVLKTRLAPAGGRQDGQPTAGQLGLKYAVLLQEPGADARLSAPPSGDVGESRMPRTSALFFRLVPLRHLIHQLVGREVSPVGTALPVVALVARVQREDCGVGCLLLHSPQRVVTIGRDSSLRPDPVNSPITGFPRRVDINCWSHGRTSACSSGRAVHWCRRFDAGSRRRCSTEWRCRTACSRPG